MFSQATPTILSSNHVHRYIYKCCGALIYAKGKRLCNKWPSNYTRMEVNNVNVDGGFFGEPLVCLHREVITKVVDVLQAEDRGHECRSRYLAPNPGNR